MPSRITLLVLSLAFAAWLPAQIQTGRLSGVVYDPNHAVVPAAIVTVTNKGTNSVQKVAANGTGVYANLVGNGSATGESDFTDGTFTTVFEGRARDSH